MKKAMFLSLIAVAPIMNLGAAPEPKVLICHVPPGNPENVQEITVGASAVPAHLAHGDTEGSCDTFVEDI